MFINIQLEGEKIITRIKLKLNDIKLSNDFAYNIVLLKFHHISICIIINTV